MSFTVSGVYTLRLTADDGATQRSDTVTFTVNDISGGGVGQLTGVHALAPGQVNVTQEGTADWAHWGLSSASSFTHKAGASPQVSDYTPVGDVQGRFTASSLHLSWSDGTPTSSASGVDSGLWAIGKGNGFQFTVSAEQTLRTLQVYVGGWEARGKLEARLSDGSAPAYVGYVNAGSSATTERVVLDYRAASDGQTLTVTYTADSVSHTWGNVTLQAATLQVGQSIAAPVLATRPQPEGTRALPNYPNPLNPDTWIPYRLAEEAPVTLDIFDLSGHLVRRISVGHRAAGEYMSRDRAIHWDGRNHRGERVSSGVYIYSFRAGDVVSTGRMLLLK